jgi:hypothetical protein
VWCPYSKLVQECGPVVPGQVALAAVSQEGEHLKAQAGSPYREHVSHLIGRLPETRRLNEEEDIGKISLKGLSHEIDLKNVDENLQNLA